MGMSTRSAALVSGVLCGGESVAMAVRGVDGESVATGTAPEAGVDGASVAMGDGRTETGVFVKRGKLVCGGVWKWGYGERGEGGNPVRACVESVCVRVYV